MGVLVLLVVILPLQRVGIYPVLPARRDARPRLCEPETRRRFPSLPALEEEVFNARSMIVPSVRQAHFGSEDDLAVSLGELDRRGIGAHQDGR